MLRDTGEELQNRASTNSEGNLGAAVRTPQKRGWEEGPPGRCKEEKVRPASPMPARLPRPSRRRASASRRRKCCVAHFRVLSGLCRRASVVSRLPPPPPLPPRILESGATSPPWPASKVGLGRWAPEGRVTARREDEGGPMRPTRAAAPALARATGSLLPRRTAGPRLRPHSLEAEVGAAPSLKGRPGRRFLHQPTLSADFCSLSPTHRPPYKG